MGLILKWLGSGVGPYVIGAAATAIVGLGLACWILQGRVEDSAAALATAQADIALCESNTTLLQGAVSRQNEEIADLRAAALAEGARADAAASDILSAPGPPASGDAAALTQWHRQFVESLR